MGLAHGRPRVHTEVGTNLLLCLTDVRQQLLILCEGVFLHANDGHAGLTQGGQFQCKVRLGNFLEMFIIAICNAVKSEPSPSGALSAIGF